MGLYLAIPKATHAPVEVATGAAQKTLLQVAIPASLDIQVCGWGISFDGASSSAVPGVVDLVGVNVAAAVTALAPEEWGAADGPASLCVGGAAATGYNATTEGTITDSRILDAQNVHPQAGYGVWFPERERPIVKAGRFLRVRSLFAATVNGIPYIIWREPPSA